MQKLDRHIAANARVVCLVNLVIQPVQANTSTPITVVVNWTAGLKKERFLCPLLAICSEWSDKHAGMQ